MRSGDVGQRFSQMRTTRREFIAETTVAAALITRIDAAAAPANPTLQKAMDAIIPPGDGMPSASEAGGLRYLTTLMQKEPGIAAEINQCLLLLDETATALFEKPVDQLSAEQLVSTLARFEAQKPVSFALLRDYVYESYYTQAAVWKLIGYDFYPTDHSGPHMQAFDDSVLAPVRAMPRCYREDGLENG
jgi:hypothetical protein